MAKALVIYDSFFGNTEKVACTIGETLSAKVKNVVDVTIADLKDLDLLVVGSPTRGFRPTPTIATFINSLPDDLLKEIKVAAFDTRIAAADVQSPAARTFLGLAIKTFGYAAKPFAKLLTRKGGTLVGEPDGFYVNDTKGPLKDAELARAKKWAKTLN